MDLVGLVDDANAVVAPVTDADKVGIAKKGEISGIPIQLPLGRFPGFNKTI